jgi:predicted 3-demethylubiquinone-9 3-methyltransferase (glyoxalase superfamily)
LKRASRGPGASERPAFFKYGLSWQINPTVLGEMLNHPDPSRANRVMKAMLQMKKIEIEDLEKAYAGATV